jgi:hypothetical protein
MIPGMLYLRFIVIFAAPTTLDMKNPGSRQPIPDLDQAKRVNFLLTVNRRE